MKECSAGSSFPHGCKYQYEHTKRTCEKQIASPTEQLENNRKTWIELHISYCDHP